MYIYIYIYIYIERERERETDRQTERYTNKQTDKNTDRETDKVMQIFKASKISELYIILVANEYHAHLDKPIFLYRCF